MNEIIRELMIKAGMQHRLDPIPVHVDENGMHTFTKLYVYDKFDPEKFAELLVRECILTIQMSITRDGTTTEKFIRSMKHINDIKEHFGVE